MQRIYQIALVMIVPALSWLIMMAVHEAGHVVGAAVTGGSVERVVLYPLTISRTDLARNPYPAIVVWLGPLIGALVPLLVWCVWQWRRYSGCAILQFVAGFCLIGNGMYVAAGSLAGVGDAGEMLQTGTPHWAMWVYGAAATSAGLYLWHRLGSFVRWFRSPSSATRGTVLTTLVLLVVILVAEFTISPQ